MVASTANEQVDQRSIVVTHTHRLANKLKRNPAVPGDLMALVMYQRGMFIHRIFRTLVDVLTAAGPDRSPSQGGLLKGDVADDLFATASPKRARTVTPKGAQESSNNDTRFSDSQRDFV